jgi:hypothetical protein
MDAACNVRRKGHGAARGISHLRQDAGWVVGVIDGISVDEKWKETFVGGTVSLIPSRIIHKQTPQRKEQKTL